MDNKTSKIDLRLAPAGRVAIEKLAAMNGRSVGAEVRAALAAYVAAAEAARR